MLNILSIICSKDFVKNNFKINILGYIKIAQLEALPYTEQYSLRNIMKKTDVHL